MALERTFSIVKPDGVARNLIGEVYRRFEKAGLHRAIRPRGGVADHASLHHHLGAALALRF